MRLVDTHCHLHDSELFPDNREEVYQQSVDAGVAMIVVGTDVRSSQQAVEFAATHEQTWPVIGVHPHEAAREDLTEIEALARSSPVPIVAIGEIGLDYFYEHSPRMAQIEALERQLQLAQDLGLPVSFHVREAYDDFWPIFRQFTGIRGVLHSYTDSLVNLERALAHELYIGVNGISTFTRDDTQKAMFAAIPLGNTLLETDAPFLTPTPYRGKMNTPAYVRLVAEQIARLKGCEVTEVEQITTRNAERLFAVKI